MKTDRDIQQIMLTVPVAPGITFYAALPRDPGLARLHFARFREFMALVESSMAVDFEPVVATEAKPEG